MLLIDLQLIPHLPVLHSLERVAVPLLPVVVQGRLVVGQHLKRVLDGRDRAVDGGELPIMNELEAADADCELVELAKHTCDELHVLLLHVEAREKLSAVTIRNQPDREGAGRQGAAGGLVEREIVLISLPLDDEDDELPAAAMLLVHLANEVGDLVAEVLVVKDLRVGDGDKSTIRRLQDASMISRDNVGWHHGVIAPAQNRLIRHHRPAQVVHLLSSQEPRPGGEVKVGRDRVGVGQEALAHRASLHHDQLLDVLQTLAASCRAADDSKALNLDEAFVDGLLGEASLRDGGVERRSDHDIARENLERAFLAVWDTERHVEASMLVQNF
mmetsp:Transcript_21783/g.72034  ORF Transcript_21783/g.72034 Transcript_21783/m.72034 type:complete len:329 (+) Transcript_21783:215-1201(+)